jgi:hypothetical protein
MKTNEVNTYETLQQFLNDFISAGMAVEFQSSRDNTTTTFTKPITIDELKALTTISLTNIALIKYTSRWYGFYEKRYAGKNGKGQPTADFTLMGYFTMEKYFKNDKQETKKEE